MDSAVIEAAATPVHEVSNDFVAPHYVRFTVADRPGILADIFAVFARHDINVEAVVQLPRYRKDRLPFVAKHGSRLGLSESARRQKWHLSEARRGGLYRCGRLTPLIGGRGR